MNPLRLASLLLLLGAVPAAAQLWEVDNQLLYAPETKVASIAILNLDEAGEIGAAAAMAILIAAANTVATLLFMALGAWVGKRTQAWKKP